MQALPWRHLHLVQGYFRLWSKECYITLLQGGDNLSSIYFFLNFSPICWISLHKKRKYKQESPASLLKPASTTCVILSCAYCTFLKLESITFCHCIFFLNFSASHLHLFHLFKREFLYCLFYISVLFGVCGVDCVDFYLWDSGHHWFWCVLPIFWWKKFTCGSKYFFMKL